jgi:hypothetical protein
MVNLLLFLALKGDSDMCTFTLRYRLYEHKRATTIAIAIVRRAITIWEAIQKRSHEPITKTYTKNEAKGLRATTLLSQSWKSNN